MGSPVSAVVANLYMEFFEELALKPLVSSCGMWMTLRATSLGKVTWMGYIHPTIKFTMEVKDGSLPFLGMKVTRRTVNLTLLSGAYPEFEGGDALHSTRVARAKNFAAAPI